MVRVKSKLWTNQRLETKIKMILRRIKMVRREHQKELLVQLNDLSTPIGFTLIFFSLCLFINFCWFDVLIKN